MIWKRRSERKPPPWTSDRTLMENSFTNIYRELDQGTIYLQINLQGSTPSEALWKTIIYRLVNRVETFVNWDEGLPSESNTSQFINWCDLSMRNGKKSIIIDHLIQLGTSIFTTAHQTSGMSALKETTQALRRIFPNFSKRVLQSSSIKECCSALKRLRGIGDFLSWQIGCDLIEGGFLPLKESIDWVSLGIIFIFF